MRAGVRGRFRSWRRGCIGRRRSSQLHAGPAWPQRLRRQHVDDRLRAWCAEDGLAGRERTEGAAEAVAARPSLRSDALDPGWAELSEAALSEAALTVVRMAARRPDLVSTPVTEQTAAAQTHATAELGAFVSHRWDADPAETGINYLSVI